MTKNKKIIALLLTVVLTAIFVEKISSLVTENSSLVTENSSLVTENSSLVTENSSLVSENSSLVSENSSLVSENSSFENIIRNLNNRIKYHYLQSFYLLDEQLKKGQFNLKFFSYQKPEILTQGISLKKFIPQTPFSYGINLDTPGTAFLDYYKENLFLVSASGITTFTKFNDNNDEIIFQQIDNNINQFINQSHFEKGKWFSIKDIKIIDNKFYLSYTNEISDKCWNTSIIRAELNYKKLNFKPFFNPKECVKNLGKNKFNAHQSGGRIINLDNETILLSIGDFRARNLSQNLNSIFGKILKINKSDKSYSFLSIGHRNPQGLYFNEEKNIIISSEHGPRGGDELNIIKTNQRDVENFGWDISSYGEHYTKEDKLNIPLKKSHKDFGFIEPVYYFTPSIGVSEISFDKNLNLFILSSLKSGELIYFDLVNNKAVIKETFQINDRIRDIVNINDNTQVIYLETTGSIGVLKSN